MRKDLIYRVAREPLVHFFLIAGLLFFLQSSFGKAAAEASKPLRVPMGEIDTKALAASWKSDWGRAPTAAELHAMACSRRQERLLATAAIEDGLLYDDRFVIQRLLTKERAWLCDGAKPQTVTDEVLHDYYRNHAEDYRVDGCYRYAEVFVSLSRRDPMQKAQQLLQLLREAHVDPGQAGSFGDQGPDSGVHRGCAEQIREAYGKGFYKQLRLFRTGIWYGPLISGKGVSLIYIMQHEGGSVAPFDAVRQRVREDCLADRCRTRLSERLRQLGSRYGGDGS